MTKALPYIYIGIGAMILLGTIATFLQKQEVYRVLFSFQTENKYIFLIVRSLFAGWFIFDGVKRLKENS